MDQGASSIRVLHQGASETNSTNFQAGLFSLILKVEASLSTKISYTSPNLTCLHLSDISINSEAFIYKTNITNNLHILLNFDKSKLSVVPIFAVPLFITQLSGIHE